VRYIYINLINSSVLHVRYMNIKHVCVARAFYLYQRYDMI
jgi:hypothetical protein